MHSIANSLNPNSVERQLDNFLNVSWHGSRSMLFSRRCSYTARLLILIRKHSSNHSLVPFFREFLVPVVFTSFKPFLLREKKVPPTLVIIRRLGFQSPFFTQIKTSSFHRFFFCFFPFLPSEKYKEF
jgi:hypothetical protein